MGDPVLSAEELSALLDEDEAGAGGRQVRDFDLTKATRVTGDLLRQLSRVHHALAQRLGVLVSHLLNRDVTAEPGGVTEQSFAAYRSSLESSMVCQVLGLRPTGETGLLVVDRSLFASCLDCLLGGIGESPIEPKPITDLDRDVVDPLLLAVLGAWSETWADILPLEADVVRTTEDAEDLEDLPSAETILTMDVRLSGTEGFEGGVLAITVPLVALEPALVKLGKPPRFATPRRPQNESQRRGLEQSLGTADLPLVFTLGTTTLTVSEVMALAAGDVLVLDQGPQDSLSGTLNDRLRVLAKPGRIGRRLAVVVQETLPLREAAKPTAAAAPSPAPVAAPPNQPPKSRPLAGKEPSHGR